MREAIVAVVGQNNVGKSSIVARLTGRDLEMAYNPTIEDSYDYVFEINTNETGTIHFYDTSGQEEYYSIPETAISNAHIVVVVCEVGQATSLKIAEEFIVRARKQHEDHPELPILLVCNKIDKQEIEEEDKKKAINLAARRNIKCWFTSALDDTGIPQLQLHLVELVKLIPKTQAKRKCCNLV